MPISQGDQFFAAIDAHTDHHQTAQPSFVQPHAEVHPIGPHVDIVGLGQVAVGESPLLILPLRGQPGHDRGRQPGGRAEELLQRGGELARAHAMEVQQRQHLGHLRAFPRPRWHDPGLKSAFLPGGGIHAAVIDPRGGSLAGGVCSTRSPGRPYPIGLHPVEITTIDYLRGRRTRSRSFGGHPDRRRQTTAGPVADR